MIAKRVRIAAHALLFLLAFVVFYLGLGLGLQFQLRGPRRSRGLAVA